MNKQICIRISLIFFAFGISIQFGRTLILMDEKHEIFVISNCTFPIPVILISHTKFLTSYTKLIINQNCDTNLEIFFIAAK